MAHRLTRRKFGIGAGAATLAGLSLGGSARAADTKTGDTKTGDTKTLRFIVQTDLRVLDPIWTTAYVSRNHGYMIFDTLFAIDFEVQSATANGRRLQPLPGQARLALCTAPGAQIP